MKVCLLAIFALALAGCAPALKRVDLSESNYQSRLFQQRSSNTVQQFTVINKAKPGEFERDGASNFSESRIPIQAEEEAKVVVERDLQEYFKASLSESERSSRKVFATIYRADAYQASKLNGTAFIPIVGAFTGSDQKIGLNLKVLVEVEDQGKVVKEFTFDQRIEKKMQGLESIEDHYKRLVAQYREQLFSELDRNVLRFMLEARN